MLSDHTATNSCRRNHLAQRGDILAGLGVLLCALALYIATLLPGLGIGDTAEFQRVVPLLELAHPTGYPLYTLTGWLWTHLLPGGSAAWRLNLFSAVAGAAAIAVLYHCARALGQPRVVAAAAALALATAPTFWSQATIAEVYALAALLQALLVLALLRWRAQRWPFWAIGLALGLGLAHHRTIVLMLPGALLFIALSRRPRPAELGQALAVTLGCCLLYLYVPLHAPAWLNRWEVLRDYLSAGSVAADWLSFRQLQADGLARPLDLLRRVIWPELGVLGTLLGLLGALWLPWRDRAAGALLLASYATTLCFCSAYYVPDIQVFLIPLHLIAALLLGVGTTQLVERLPRRAVSAAGALLLALPALLLYHNLPAIRAANTLAPEQSARAQLARLSRQPALVVGDWRAIEGMRYLQAVEGQRLDIEFAMVPSRDYLLAAIAHGRRVYLMAPVAELGLAQSPEGGLWRVSAEPLRADSPTDQRWADGIRLAAYTIPRHRFRPGDPVPITLEWQAYRPPHQSYVLFIHLVGPDGVIRGQRDRIPSGASTADWSSGGRYLDLFDPVLSPDTPAGRYYITMGWYEYPSLHRLPLASQGGTAARDFVTLGEIDVVP
jgi:hypothetical protein